MIVKTFTKTCMCAVLSIAATVASAQTLMSNFYIGAGVGAARAESVTAQIQNAFAVGNVGTLQSTSTDRSDTGYKLFVGYQFTPNIALELSFADYGSYAAAYAFTRGSSITNTAAWDASAINLDGVFSVPVAPQIDLFARAGVSFSRLKYSEDRPDSADRFFVAPSENQSRGHLGVGASWNFMRNAALRLEWERTFGVGRTFSFITDAERSNGKLDYDLLSLSAQYRF